MCDIKRGRRDSRQKYSITITFETDYFGGVEQLTRKPLKSKIFYYTWFKNKIVVHNIQIPSWTNSLVCLYPQSDAQHVLRKQKNDEKSSKMTPSRKTEQMIANYSADLAASAFSATTRPLPTLIEISHPNYHVIHIFSVLLLQWNC